MRRIAECLGMIVAATSLLTLGSCSTQKHAATGSDAEVRSVLAAGGVQGIATGASSAIQPRDLSLDASALQQTKAEVLLRTARQLLGSKYKGGSMGPDRFDCSGFTSFVFLKHGIKLNRSSRDQWNNGVPVEDTRQLLPGDLVFWKGSNARSKVIGHVGIVTEVDHTTGAFTFIHAAMTGVQYDQSEADYYKKRYVGARRVL